MNRNLGISARVVTCIALCIALSISTLSCEYFDPLDPLNRGLTDGVTTWEKSLGGGGDDVGFSVQQTTDGGYIITGYTGTYGGSYALLLIKTDAYGNEEWSKSFGNEGTNSGHCVQQTTDGGYIITGTTNSIGAGGDDVWLIKTDADGKEEWSKTFGGSADDEGWCVRCTSDGGYIITGITFSFGAGSCDAYLIKTDSSGTAQWSVTFGDSNEDCGYSVRQTTDGGYIIAGLTEGLTPGDDNAYLVKTDASGAEEWSKKFGKTPDLDGGTCVQQTTDGGYILVGYTHSYGAEDFNVWMIKTDSSGEEQWSTTFGGDAWDRADAVQQTADGGYVIAGMTRSFGAWEQVWLIKTDADGTEEWSKTFGGTGNDRALFTEQVADGGYIITGYTNSFPGGPDVYLIYYKP